MDAWLQAITTVGFPIVMCGVMAWYVKYQTDKNREDVKALNDQHTKEMMEVTEAINNNTQALIALKETMKKGE
jgi:hypothetical protein